MLVGDHPLGYGPECSVYNPQCRHRWVFACWALCETVDPRTKKKQQVRCGLRTAIDCGGGQHILLDEAIQAIQQRGWTRAPHGGGWRCPMHS